MTTLRRRSEPRRRWLALFWLALCGQLLSPVLHAAGLRFADTDNGAGSLSGFCSADRSQAQRQLIAALPAEVREHFATGTGHHGGACDHCVCTGAAALPATPATAAVAVVNGLRSAPPATVLRPLPSLRLPPATGPPAQL